jgi:hypothetical protein
LAALELEGKRLSAVKDLVEPALTVIGWNPVGAGAG